MDRISESDVQVLENIYNQPGKVEVYKVRHYQSKEILCMKKLYVENVQDATLIQGESISMAMFNHDHILKLRSCSMGGVDRQISHIIIYMQYLEEGDLEKMIAGRVTTRSFFTEKKLLKYLKQLASAYHYMQTQQSCAHRDIKPQNIFVADKGKNLIVGDLGSAVKKSGNSGVTLTGTPLYLSPRLREAFMKSSMTGNWNTEHNVYKSDVYSLGLTFLYMASLVPIKDLAVLNDLQGLINRRIEDIADRYGALAPILDKMLRVDEEERVDFVGLMRILDKSNSDILLTPANFKQNQWLVIKTLEAVCEVCKQTRLEGDIYFLFQGVICKECILEASRSFFPRNK